MLAANRATSSGSGGNRVKAITGRLANGTSNWLPSGCSLSVGFNPAAASKLSRLLLSRPTSASSDHLSSPSSSSPRYSRRAPSRFGCSQSSPSSASFRWTRLSRSSASGVGALVCHCASQDTGCAADCRLISHAPQAKNRAATTAKINQCCRRMGGNFIELFLDQKNRRPRFLTPSSGCPKGGHQLWQAIKKPHLGAAFDSSAIYAAIEPLSLFIAFFSS